jgi:hypothetical protein
MTLSNWLAQASVVGPPAGSISVNTIRHDFTAVNSPAQRWMYLTNPAQPLHFTFDTPFTQGGTPGTCGRVVYSDFHVEDNVVSTTTAFPGECNANALTPQEKLLEFMIFDLTSCVAPPTCQPLTCQQLGYNCGTAGDGCGGTISCGNCTAACPTDPQSCGGGGKPNVCGSKCTPLTCQQIGCTTGAVSDGCGCTINCPCTAPQTCGGGGQAGVCGTPSCTKLTCANFPGVCGVQSDGCGGQTAFCNPCQLPAYCGGGGPGVCGIGDAGGCTPATTCPAGQNCGFAPDGCGGTVSCGSCTSTCPAQSCGGGGTPNVCGTKCVPETCQQLGIECGPAGDGCGCPLNCGNCPSGQTCGGGGTPGKCGTPPCVPTTCGANNCGVMPDGCGGANNCGSCAAGSFCGPGQNCAANTCCSIR